MCEIIWPVLIIGCICISIVYFLKIKITSEWRIEIVGEING